MVNYDKSYHPPKKVMPRYYYGSTEIVRPETAAAKECHHFDSYHDRKPASKMEKSEQNQQWNENRPGINKWDIERLKERQIKCDQESRTKKYNKKYSNHLTSHNGESRISRVDKMSGVLSKWYRKDAKAGVKKNIRKFYHAKRRMFLKNPNNFDKI